jgi:hypothetical protein
MIHQFRVVMAGQCGAPIAKPGARKLTLPALEDLDPRCVQPHSIGCAQQIKHSRPRRFFGTIGFRGRDRAANRLDRKQT